MSEELKCPICGKPTRVFMGNARKDRLCGYHADMCNRGSIRLNSEGIWVYRKGNPVEITADKPQETPEDEPIKELAEEKAVEESPTAITEEVEEEEYISKKEIEYSAFKCIACGRETKSGNLFCGSCYYKYKDKKILVSISKCKDIEIMDDMYEGMYRCKDGHIVKSKSEKYIDNYLFDHGIPHAYERTLTIDANKDHDLHPDFFLPNFKGSGKDIYIEHWGYNSNNREYTKSKKYKIKKYTELGLTIISTNEKDITDTEAALERKLNHFEYGKVNFADEE